MGTPVVHIPDSTAEALALLAAHGDDAKPIAGGTALMIMLKTGLIEPARLISLSRIHDGLREVSVRDGRLRLGALVTLRRLERDPQARAAAPLLAAASGLVANVRVRNVATVGGNLSEADYASDPPCVLMALGARMQLSSAAGERSVAIEDFLTDYYETCLRPDELVTAVDLPERPTAPGRYLKFVTRSTEDRPCLGVAALVEREPGGACRQLSVAVGAATAIPFRVAEAEQLALGEQVTDDLLDEIGEQYARHAEPLSDLRGSRDYRRKMIRLLVRRAIRQAADGETGALQL